MVPAPTMTTDFMGSYASTKRTSTHHNAKRIGSEAWKLGVRMKHRIAIVFGSDSDWPVMEKCVAQLAAFDEHPFVEVMSAHRNPARVAQYASGAEAAGIEVIIAAAGMSNALAGAVAAHTCLPVIGVPLANGPLSGFDALLSTLQMPPGIPVAGVSVGEAGAKNAALLAIQIIARHDPRLAAAYRKFKDDQAQAVGQKNAALQQKFNKGGA